MHSTPLLSDPFHLRDMFLCLWLFFFFTLFLYHFYPCKYKGDYSRRSTRTSRDQTSTQLPIPAKFYRDSFKHISLPRVWTHWMTNWSKFPKSKGSIPTRTHGALSAAISLRKELSTHCLVFSDGILNRRSRVCVHIACTIPTHFLKKTRQLWPEKMDNSVPTHKRRKHSQQYVTWCLCWRCLMFEGLLLNSYIYIANNFIH